MWLTLRMEIPMWMTNLSGRYQTPKFRDITFILRVMGDENWCIVKVQLNQDRRLHNGGI